MSSRVIEIVVDVNDATGGKLGGIQSKLLAMDKAVQRMHSKLAAFGNRAYAATIRLIDRVTPQGSKINNLLRSLASKAYNISMKVNDTALAKIRSIEASLMKIAGRAYTVAINVKDNVSGKLKGLTDGALMGMGTMGAGLLGTAGIGYGVVNAVQSYMDFEKQMSQVQAVRGLEKDSAEMRALTEKAKDLGATTAWTRSEAAQAMYYQAMAGWDVNQIMAATPAIMNLASAGNTDLATTSDIVTDTLTGFHVNAQEKYRDSSGRVVNAAEHYADVMAATVTNSNTKINELGEALKYSSNVIGAMYADKDIQTRFHAIEDAMTMTGLMANAGIKGSMAGTATRALFSRFSSENRNAEYALQALGVDFRERRADGTKGEVRRIRDVFKDLNQRFTEGVNADALVDFAEALEGTKLHADTRRKLTGFLESVQANGGKMTGGDKLKMASMLAGQEAMSGVIAAITGDWDKLADAIDNAHGKAEEMAKIQLDNLAGDITILGSAWDAFQQSFFEGQAGDGLRNFVQSLTEIISRANNLFKDGIQIGDIGNIIADVVDRLKNKFLELDGVGSILAGGALMAGLSKIISTAQKAIGYFRTLRGLEIGQRLGGAAGSKGTGAISGATSVGTMNVTAGVVNINGRVGGAGGAGGVGGRRIGDQTIIDRYNQEKARIRGNGTPPPPAVSIGSTMRNAAMGGAAFAAIFGALDVMNAKSMSEERTSSIATELEQARTAHQELIHSGAANDELYQSAAHIQQLERDQAQIIRENQQSEREALGGASGSVIGAAIGAGLGSFLPGFGTMIGGMVGGIVGGHLGTKAAQIETPTKEKPVADYFGFKEPQTAAAVQTTTPPPSSFSDFRQMQTAQPIQQQTLGEVFERNKNRDEQIARFEKIDERLSKVGASPFKSDGGAAEYYRQQRAQLATTAKQTNAPEGLVKSWSDFKQKIGDLNLGEKIQQPLEAAAETVSAALIPSLFTTKLLGGGRAEAAELNESQLAQQAQMERGESPTAEMTTPEVEAPNFGESFLESLSTLPESVSEILSGLGETISEGFNSAFEGAGETLSTFGETIMETLSGSLEGVGEVFSGLGESISENLSAAFESASEIVSSFGTMLGEGLTSVLEGAGEMFSGFCELVSSALATAQGAAESALAAISAAFESCKAMIMGSWSELPGFFGGLFDGLGGIASAAGAAIYSGLTSVIGSIIGAWQSAASTISGIISSIASMASSAASSIGSISFGGGGGGAGFAEGGFVNSETHFFAGEHGPEVIIPLSSAKRSRALDLFEKTGAILGGESAIPTNDYATEDLPELGGGSGLPTIEGNAPAMTNNQTSTTTSVTMGGLNVTFNITGDKPQEIMETIKENLDELADRIMGAMSGKVADCFNNQALEG